MTIPPPPLATIITTDPALYRDQHVVAESYLKPWRDPATNQGAYLWISPKDRSTAPTTRSPKKTFIVPDMNTMTKEGLRNLALENMYQRFESSFGNLKARIVDGHPLINDDHEAIVAFVAAQLIRTPKFRDRWQFSFISEKRLSRIADPTARLAIEQVRSHISTNRYQLLCFLALPKAVELLGNMRMTLLRADDSQYFITSDAPCCVIEYRDKIATMFETLKSPTSNVLMPLSPTVMAVFDHSDKPHGMIGLFPNQPIVQELNAIIWKGAVKEVVTCFPTLQSEWFSERVEKKLASYTML